MPNEKIILAGGCFWCTQSLFKSVPGVVSAVSGYTGGRIENPTYEEVCSGRSGHVEAVEVTYDPAVETNSLLAGRQDELSLLEKILEIFWRDIDPTDSGGQFADRGTQYQTAIFYSTDEQKRIAEESKKKLQESGRFDRPIVTKILKAAKFFPAEEYHQNYSQKAPDHYKRYRIGSGREEFVRKTWQAES